MQSVTFETAQSAAIIAVTFGILLSLAASTIAATVKREVISWAHVFMCLQAILCCARALTLLIQTVVPTVNCKWLGIIGMAIYACWVTCLDAVLLLRTFYFLMVSMNSRTLFFWIGISQLCISFGSLIYVAISAYSINQDGTTCIVLADFGKGTIALVNRCIMYIYLIYPFAARAFASYMNTDERFWMTISINNALFAFVIILTEVVATFVSSDPSLLPWLSAFFAWVNCIECIMCLQIVEDTRKQLSNQSKNVLSTTQENNQFNTRANHSKSYLDG
ncbi:hypothetical protein EDD86DRAFT_211002, partial [Gorgonomyces haynaldii]